MRTYRGRKESCIQQITMLCATRMSGCETRKLHCIMLSEGLKEFGLCSRTELKDQWVHLLDDIAAFLGLLAPSPQGEAYHFSIYLKIY